MLQCRLFDIATWLSFIPLKRKKSRFHVENETYLCVGADGFEPPTLCL